MAIIAKNGAGDALDFSAGGVDVQLDDVALNVPVVTYLVYPSGRRSVASVTVTPASTYFQVAVSQNGPWVSYGSTLALGIISDSQVAVWTRQVTEFATGEGSDVACYAIADPGDEDIPEAPAFTSGPSVTAYSYNSITLSWVATDPDLGDTVAAKAIIKTSTSTPTSGEWAAANVVASPVQFQTLAANTAYSMWVQITDGVHTVTSSRIAQTTAAAPTNQAPQFTVAPTVGSITHEGYTLSWSQTDAEGDAIAVFLSTDSGEFVDVTSSVTGTTTKQLAITGKAANTTYSEVLRLCDDGHPGALGTASSPVSCRTAPAAPTSLSCANPGSDDAAIAFTAPAGASAMGVYYKVSTDPEWTTATEAGSTTSPYNLGSLADDTTYDVRMRAKNSANSWGAYSSTLQFTTDLLGQVGTVTPTAGDAQVSLAFSPVTGATHYRIKYSVNSNMSSATTVTPNYAAINGNSGTQTFVVTGLTSGTLYYFTVEAFDGTNYGAASTTVSATPANPVTLLDNGFNSGSDEADIGSPWTETKAVSGTAKYDSSQSVSGGMAARLTNVNSSGSMADIRETSDAAGAVKKFRFWLRHSVADAHWVHGLFPGNPDSPGTFFMSFGNVNNVSIYVDHTNGPSPYNTADYHTIGSYSINTWYQYQIELDFTTHLYKVGRRTSTGDAFTYLKKAEASNDWIPMRSWTVSQSGGIRFANNRYAAASNFWVDEVEVEK